VIIPNDRLFPVNINSARRNWDYVVRRQVYQSFDKCVNVRNWSPPSTLYQQHTLSIAHQNPLHHFFSCNASEMVKVKLRLCFQKLAYKCASRRESFTKLVIQQLDLIASPSLTIASRNSGPDGFLSAQALVGFHPSVESIDKRRMFDGVNDQDSRWFL
jgi:hypothetical protein